MKTFLKKFIEVLKIPFKGEEIWFISVEKNKIKSNFYAPKNYYWADPFGIQEKDKYYIFFEEAKLREDFGTIKCLELDKNLNLIQIKKVLERPYHLSYPNVFRYNNKFYMVPETHKNKTIELYEAINFPFKWKLTKTLIKNIDAADPTFFIYKNEFYIFANVDNHLKNLTLFKSNDFLNSNFEKVFSINRINSKTTRNGGQVIIKKNKIFRISQNCENGYGNFITILKVINLGGKFKEKTFKVIKPPKNLYGIHTYNICNNLIIKDYKIKRNNLIIVFKNFIYMFKKIYKKLFFRTSKQ